MEQPAEGLWTGLRRRKVVQWGITSIAAAWGLLQGLAYLGTVFQWPAPLQRPVTVAFLVGLPGFRNSATFKNILNGMGVPVYWRQQGFPPMCRAVGAKDFTCD